MTNQKVGLPSGGKAQNATWIVKAAFAFSLMANVTLAVLLAFRESQFSASQISFPSKNDPLASSLSGGDFSSSELEEPVLRLSEDTEFSVVVLGSGGGPDESNISGFLVRPSSQPIQDGFLALDAGSLIFGVGRALERGGVPGFVADPENLNTLDEAKVSWLEKYVKAYCITHNHLDHISGLVIGSQVDGVGKSIIGLNATIDGMRDSIFNYVAWPNLANEGINPVNFYKYLRLAPGDAVSVEGITSNVNNDPQFAGGVKLTVQAYPLSHAGVTSTAFLIRNDARVPRRSQKLVRRSNGNVKPVSAVGSPPSFLLYLGDVGPDSLESKPLNIDLWKRIAPLVRSRQIRAIFIECSYLSDRPDGILYGHLTPKYIIQELKVLAGLVASIDRPSSSLSRRSYRQKRNSVPSFGPGSADEYYSLFDPAKPLNGLNIIVYHIKSTNAIGGAEMRLAVRQELEQINDLGLRFSLPVPGTSIQL